MCCGSMKQIEADLNKITKERDDLKMELLSLRSKCDKQSTTKQSTTITLTVAPTGEAPNLRSLPEPYKIKSVEMVELKSQEQRSAAIKEAGYNTFLLQSSDVYIDLLTDSGTNAMSDSMWAALMVGDESYAGAKSFERLEKAIQETYGFKYVVPVHQGRAAEHILSQTYIKKGDYVPGNMYFTTTRLHQELAGAIFRDVIIDEAHKPFSQHPFKGDVDLNKLKALVDEVSAKNIPYITIGAPVNMAGGQPISMKSIKEVGEYCRPLGIKMILDGARTVENCYLIQKREEGYDKKSIKEILLELSSHFDGMTMSAKKDFHVNIGGFLATNDSVLFEKARQMVVVYEGLHTYGGLAGRDMEAMAVGCRQMVDSDSVITHRCSQIKYLHDLLTKAGVAIVNPAGGHCVMLDAKAFLPHLDQEEMPAQALAAALYESSGIRTMERGIVSAGRNPDGTNRHPELELVRITFPRRVYTQSHIDYVADEIIKLYKKKSEIQGLKFDYEPPNLRFFQSRFVRVPLKK